MTTDNVTPLPGRDRVAAIAPTTEAEALAATAEPWPEVLPFDGVELPPPFPVDALPPVLARFITDTAAAMGTEPDLVATSVLATVSAVAGGRWTVAAPWRPEWREQLVLYVAAVAPPGSMKSAAMATATAPLATLQRELKDRYRVEVADALSRRRIDEKRLADLETQAAKATAEDPGNTRELALDLARSLAAEPVRTVPSIYTTDATTEKVETLLGDNGERYAWIDSEGGLFTLLSGRYASKGGGVSLDIFLKAYSGDYVEVERMGRAAVELHSPALTIGIATQPAHLQAAMGNVQEGKGRGLFDRFLYSWPESAPVDRSQPTREVVPAVVKGYADAIHRLYRAAEVIAPGDRRTLGMDPDAADALQAFARWTFEAGQSGGVLDVDGMRDWSSKLPGQVHRLAGLLALAANPTASTVDLDAATGAVRLGRYFAEHTRRTFRDLDLVPAVAAARRCWRAITEATPRGGRWKEWPEVVTTRDVSESVKGSKALGLNTKEGVAAALADLATEYHLLRRLPDEKNGVGRPSERWEVHPDYRPG